MADCMLVEGIPVCEDGLLNDSDLFLGCGSEDSNNTLDSIKSGFFVLSEGKALCPKFEINGQVGSCVSVDNTMIGSDSEAFTAALKLIDEETVHSCQKKRCADRYDSSESSDSGVATLCCTDCSGSSSGTSDITEPGSPLSTSSHSESDLESSPAKMPPTQTSAWHWSDVTFLDTKRLKHHLNDNNNAKQMRLEDCVHSKCCKVSLQQGKITEYFKAQLKPQKKYDSKYHITNCDSSRKKLAVRLSNTIVPVAAKLSLVFQQQKHNKKVSNRGVISKSNRLPTNSSPQHRKTLNSSHELSKIQVTSVFRKPDSIPKCSSLDCVSDDSIDSVSLPEPKTPPEDCELKTTCSTPIPSPSNSPSPPLSISTLEHCLEKPSLPSPILRTPSIIRFPVRSGWQGHFLGDIMCRWSDCEEAFSTNSALLEHLQVKHVNTQSLSETFVCRWIGCKVFDRASCSRSWLERHVLSHGGNKPFRCIVDGCGQRFSSQVMLERHVNQHFSSSENSSSSGTTAKRSLESTPNKLFRRNGKKIRYRRQPFSARMFDYIDTGIMEGLQHSLLEVSKRQPLVQSDCTSSKSITLQSKVMGRRTTNDGTATVLLRWFPSGIVKDEWVPLTQVTSTRQVAWKQCQEQQEWSGPPLFCCRPRLNQRKHQVSR